MEEGLIKIRTILIDDSDTDLFTQEFVLESCNFDTSLIQKFLSGKEALYYLKQNPPTEPVIIFLDLNMPVMNGFSFLDELSLLNEDYKKYLRVVILTSGDSRGDHKRSFEYTLVKYYITKPLKTFHIPIVLDRISFKAEVSNQDKAKV